MDTQTIFETKILGSSTTLSSTLNSISLGEPSRVWIQRTYTVVLKFVLSSLFLAFFFLLSEITSAPLSALSAVILTYLHLSTVETGFF